MTWQEMILQEPRLLELERISKRVTLTDYAYASLKLRLSALVGMDSNAADERMRTAKAWDIAHSKILGRW